MRLRPAHAEVLHRLRDESRAVPESHLPVERQAVDELCLMGIAERLKPNPTGETLLRFAPVVTACPDVFYLLRDLSRRMPDSPVNFVTLGPQLSSVFGVPCHAELARRVAPCVAAYLLTLAPEQEAQALAAFEAHIPADPILLREILRQGGSSPPAIRAALELALSSEASEHVARLPWILLHCSETDIEPARARLIETFEDAENLNENGRSLDPIRAIAFELVALRDLLEQKPKRARRLHKIFIELAADPYDDCPRRAGICRSALFSLRSLLLEDADELVEATARVEVFGSSFRGMVSLIEALGAPSPSALAALLARDELQTLTGTRVVLSALQRLDPQRAQRVLRLAVLESAPADETPDRRPLLLSLLRGQTNLSPEPEVLKDLERLLASSSSPELRAEAALTLLELTAGDAAPDEERRQQLTAPLLDVLAVADRAGEACWRRAEQSVLDFLERESTSASPRVDIEPLRYTLCTAMPEHVSPGRLLTFTNLELAADERSLVERSLTRCLVALESEGNYPNRFNIYWTLRALGCSWPDEAPLDDHGRAYVENEHTVEREVL